MGVVDLDFIRIADLRSILPGYEPDCLDETPGSKAYAHDSSGVLV